MMCDAGASFVIHDLDGKPLMAPQIVGIPELVERTRT